MNRDHRSIGSPGAAAPARLSLRSSAGRWTLAAAILGSGTVFLETTVVNVALPAMGRDLQLGIAGLQWVVDSYLLTLSSLMLLGGVLGDVFQRRRVLLVGLLGFAAGSGLAAVAPTPEVLVAVRLLQGAGGALLVPNSLAIVDASFAREERGTAIGRWAGWAGICTSLGPLAGGYLVEALSWRWVFAAIVPLALGAAWVAWRRVPDLSLPLLEVTPGWRRIDFPGAALATLGLAGTVAALVSGPSAGFGHPAIIAAGAIGVAALAGFVAVERRTPRPLLPLALFRVRQFTGVNLVTLLAYAAIAGFFFMLMLQLQNGLGYRALLAGAALLPIDFLLLLLSPLAGRLGQRFGPRWPMTVGSLLACAGLILLAPLRPGASYTRGILPGLVVFGIGLAALVAPLTAAVLGAVPSHETGLASGINNAIARLAGLLSIAALPLAAGLSAGGGVTGPVLARGYLNAMLICSGLFALAAAATLVTQRTPATVAVTVHPSPAQACAQCNIADDHIRRVTADHEQT